ncbi:MAG: 16S rRNA (uracil(1498)-N(3))-methyltransferase [Deltaproteobacteria bacterium]|nr:16S rRNA (uracil(1498)-N(3))-methyltransferase [Deltaproteobacteria bacterium]
MSAHLVKEIPHAGGVVPLDPAERRHIERALRLHPGDALIVFDGRGKRARGVLAQAEDKTLVVRIVEILAAETMPRRNVTAVCAAIKGDRLFSAAEKLTELGVENIIFFVASRSNRAISAGTQERLTRVAAAAAKQCGRSDVPGIFYVDSLAEAIVLVHESEIALRLILAHDGERSMAAAIRENGGGSVAFLVGPEGGWTNEERSLAGDHGFTGVRLGDFILRSDTAAAAALAVIAGEADQA